MKEVPSEDDPKVAIRVVGLIVVDVHAVTIEVADVDEVAVRATIAHSRPEHRGSRFTAEAAYSLFPLNLIRPQPPRRTGRYRV